MVMETKSELGERIKALRQARNEDQIDVAVAVGVARPTVTEWELGKKKPGRKRLEAVAQHFGVTMDFLARGEPMKRGMQPINPAEEQLLSLARRVDEGVVRAAITMLEAAAGTAPEE